MLDTCDKHTWGPVFFMSSPPNITHTLQDNCIHAAATMGGNGFWVCAVQMMSLLSAILGMQYFSHTVSTFIHPRWWHCPRTFYLHNGFDLTSWTSFTPDLVSELKQCSAVITLSIFSQTFTKDPIACPLGRGMGWLLRIRHLLGILPQFL